MRDRPLTSKDLSFAFYPGWVTDRNQSPGNPERFKHDQVSGERSCDHEEVSHTSKEIVNWAGWDAYPESWPKPGRVSLPLGTVPFSERISEAADRRMAAIRKDLASAGPYYPREEVKRVLAYWSITI